jgi:hypothetical protein
MNNIPSEKLSARQIFTVALRLEDKDQRQAYLQEACGEDAALRKLVESLLAASPDIHICGMQLDWP